MNEPKNKKELLDKIQTAVAEYVGEYEDYEFDIDVDISVEDGWATARELKAKIVH